MSTTDFIGQLNFQKYIGVVIAQVACTLVLYIILKIVHFCVWGYTLSDKNTNIESKQEADVDQRRWDQQGWDLCFPIIFANHIFAIAMPLIYLPSIFVCVVAFIHFGLFIGLIIVNVFIRDLEPGKGARTISSRVFWGLMCVCNIILFITGLVRVREVL